jgi:hypothetical protein
VTVGTATLPVAVAVAVLLVLVAAALVLRRRARMGAARRSRPPASEASGFLCPFCRRAYDPARTGRRCPACGAAAPRS